MALQLHNDSYLGEPIGKDSLMAWMDGYDAHFDKVPLNDNPHGDSCLAAQWKRGWMDGQLEKNNG